MTYLQAGATWLDPFARPLARHMGGEPKSRKWASQNY